MCRVLDFQVFREQLICCFKSARKGQVSCVVELCVSELKQEKGGTRITHDQTTWPLTIGIASRLKVLCSVTEWYSKTLNEDKFSGDGNRLGK